MKYVILLLITVSTALANNEDTLEEFVNANNLFAASFYNQIRKESQDSFLISPYSAEAVLAFLQSGCKGSTAQEIRNTLHLPDDKHKVESLVSKSISVLKGNDVYTLYTANKIYVRENFPIKYRFKKAANEVYHADAANIIFEPRERAAKIMNDWVEQQTNNKIKNLISPDVLEGVVTILINAVYFKGKWTCGFAEVNTRKKDFHKTNGDVVQTDMMHLYGEWFDHYDNPELDAQFLKMPFKGGEASMIIVLPNKEDGLASLENQIGKVFGPQQFESQYFNVQLPKYKIESRLSLVKTLERLGIKRAFNASQANLSGIAGKEGDLVVSDALQQTYINVEEKGVEAGASTYAGIMPISLPPPPKSFIANHPFIFYIKARGFIIFAGRYSGPV